MSGKVIVMSKIKQLIRMYESGTSNRKIATNLGIDKGTVNDYVRKLKSGGQALEELLALDDPVLEGVFSAGTAAYTDKRFEDFKELLPWLEQELGRKHVTRYLLSTIKKFCFLFNVIRDVWKKWIDLLDFLFYPVAKQLEVFLPNIL